MKPKDVKRAEAEARREARAQRTDFEQLMRLEAVPGKAAKERARLLKREVARG